MTRCPLSRREAGGATVELVLLTPALIALLLLVVAGGRVATAQQRVNGAARDAARAASIERDPEAARRAAHATVIATLAQAQLTCTGLDVATDASGFRPGGTVAVRVTCDVRLSDLTLLRLPGIRTMTGRFAHPVDFYRGTLP